MTWTDALLITAMGMGVTFVGLILTNLSINSFALLPKIRRLAARRRAAGPDAPAAAAESAAGAASLPADVLAVLLAVLSVEIRLARSYSASRFTLPLAVRGRRSINTNCEGTMWAGSLSPR